MREEARDRLENVAAGHAEARQAQAKVGQGKALLARRGRDAQVTIHFGADQRRSPNVFLPLLLRHAPSIAGIGNVGSRQDRGHRVGGRCARAAGQNHEVVDHNGGGDRATRERPTTLDLVSSKRARLPKHTAMIGLHQIDPRVVAHRKASKAEQDHREASGARQEARAQLAGDLGRDGKAHWSRRRPLLRYRGLVVAVL